MPWLVTILKGVVILRSSTDFDSIFHIVDKDFTIAWGPGAQHFFRCRYHQGRRDLGYHNINLELGVQAHAGFDTPVLAHLSQLGAAAHDMADRHAGDSDTRHCIAQGGEAAFFAENSYLAELFGIGMAVHATWDQRFWR